MALEEQDQAGQSYWNRAWEASPLPPLWRVDSTSLAAHVERAFFSYISEAFLARDLTNRDKLLVEAGCARSAILPLFATKLGFNVAGIDYSPNGCQQARMILEREGVSGDVYCHDVFAIPDHLAEKFDVVVSFGLIEHFADTAAIVTALARLIKPGGIILTNIPNMNGATGLLQKMLDRKVYDIHVPLTAESVRAAHRDAGLDVLACDYFLSTNFGVVNLNSVRVRSAEWWLKRVVLAIMARLSMIVWFYERAFGALRTSRTFSPYVNCVAMKPK